MRAGGLWLAVAAVVASCVSAKMEVDVPESPDMDPLVQAYDFPAAPFSLDLLDDLMGQALDNLELLEQLGLLPEGTAEAEDPISMALAALTGSLEQKSEGRRQSIVVHGDVESQEQALEVAGEEVTGDGYVEVMRTCNGWGATPTPDEAENGTVALTAVFSDQGFDAVVWGQANACKYLMSGVKLLLDGEVEAYTGDMLPQWDGTTFVSGPAEELLISFDGKATATVTDKQGKTSTTELPGSFDFRLLLAEDSLEISLDTPEGNVVFFVSQTEVAGQVASEEGFIGSNGTWVCNFEAKTCEQR